MDKLKKDLVILGGGPGGYTAAFRAADLGRKVTIVEKEKQLGGVCLNAGCIPSKTLLHVSEVAGETESLKEAGVFYPNPGIDLEKLKKHKSSVIEKLTSGLAALAAERKVDIIRGTGTFLSDTELAIVQDDKTFQLEFEDIVIAAGSRPVEIPGIPYGDPGIWDSTGALELNEIPGHLLIIGGGIIGLEMAAIYYSLGSRITIVEMAEELIPPADRDLKQPLLKRIRKEYEGIYTSSRITEVKRAGSILIASIEGKKAPKEIQADAVLAAVGRRPNSDKIGLEKTSLKKDERGFIRIDRKQRTANSRIYAIGDITGNPMLAHRAVSQGKIAAETASGKPSAFTPMAIPSVAYTSPEIAWAGLTEKEAAAEGIKYEKASFPWQASGRALSALAGDGITKVLFDPETERIIGAGIAGKNAGELIGEAVLAIEMGATAGDIAGTIHPHPTLSETFGLTGEIAEGTVTDLLNSRKK